MVLLPSFGRYRHHLARRLVSKGMTMASHKKCPNCGGTLVFSFRRKNLKDKNEIPVVWLKCRTCPYLMPDSPICCPSANLIKPFDPSNFDEAIVEAACLRIRLAAAISEAAGWKKMFFEAAETLISADG